MTDPPPEHPGTIRDFDSEGELVSELPIDEVPEFMRLAPDEDERPVPIVEVVARETPWGREILQYGPHRKLLRVTAQRRVSEGEPDGP